MWAAARGHTATVQYLLEQGASLEAKNYDGWTALMWTVSKGQTATVQLLLDKGARVEPKDSDGYTALDFAMKYGNDEVMTTILRDPEAARRKAAEEAEAAR
eukprot:Hpha_TRINITY_DN16216_c1_g1::TRINITY_DN16216_c1_g1_i6::g.12737::m.12737